MTQLLENKKVASDNYGDHASQSMMMQMKVVGCLTDINLGNPENRGASTQVYPFEIDEERKKEQLTPLQMLNAEMKSVIEKEFDERLRDPNGLLPTDLDSIKMNKDVQYYHQRDRDGPQTRNLVATRAVETGALNKEMNPKMTMRKTGDIHTSKIGETNAAHTENSSKSKVAVQNNATIQEKIHSFKMSLENENKHLVLTENENRLNQSGSHD